MFDSYSPHLKLEMREFKFFPNRYELWMDGSMTKSGKTSMVISGRSVLNEGVKRFEIACTGDNAIDNLLSSSNEFDLFITLHDRLILLTLPEITNIECVGLEFNRQILGATRHEKKFSYKEPYCCNLFTKDKRIAKLTFGYGSPEKLLEFYSTLFHEGDDQSPEQEKLREIATQLQKAAKQS